MSSECQRTAETQRCHKTLAGICFTVPCCLSAPLRMTSNLLPVRRRTPGAGVCNATSRERLRELLQPVLGQAAHGRELGDDGCPSELAVKLLGCQEAAQTHVAIAVAALACRPRATLTACFGPCSLAAVHGVSTAGLWTGSAQVISSTIAQVSRHGEVRQAAVPGGAHPPVWLPGRLTMRWARAALKSCAWHNCSMRLRAAAGSCKMQSRKLRHTAQTRV